MCLGAQKFLTTFDASDIESSGLMFCVPIERPLLERSSVLQALQEAGHAGAISQLPEGISSEAFFLWSRADLRIVDKRFHGMILSLLSRRATLLQCVHLLFLSPKLYLAYIFHLVMVYGVVLYCCVTLISLVSVLVTIWSGCVVLRRRRHVHISLGMLLRW